MVRGPRRAESSEEGAFALHDVALAAPPSCTLENVIDCPSFMKKSTFFWIRLPLTKVPFAELVGREGGCGESVRARTGGAGAGGMCALTCHAV